MVLDRLPLRPGARVLDVGCALGDDLIRVARLVGPDGLAVAAAPDARRRPEGAEFVLAATDDLPFPDDDFDVVVAPRPADPSTERELARVTAPGGTLVWA